MFRLLGDFVPQTTDQGSAAGPRWGTPFKNLWPPNSGILEPPL